MNAQQIQKDVINYIPEFNGENMAQNQNELSRFINSADNIYSSLETKEHKEVFNRCIKLRLAGEAYARINKRQIDNYETLKKILAEMYTKVSSLEELQKSFLETKQKYGETVRCFGYRLCEALDQYKKGYMNKYKRKDIDNTYTEYLNDTAIQIFKRGLNNIILKEKIATHRAKTVEEILDETETIEQMLLLTINVEPQPQEITPNSRTQTNYLTDYTRPPPVICNYCQRPNHTYNVCRSRLAAQRNAQFANQGTRQQFNSYGNNYSKPNTPQTTQNNFIPRTFNNNNGYQTQPQNNFTQYRQPQQRKNYEPKYCSHCKTTTGHTFNECRSKFFNQKPYNTNDYPRQNHTQNNYQHRQPNSSGYPQQQQNIEHLEKELNKLRINQIIPQQQNSTHPHLQTIQHESENSNGSNQQ